MVCDTSICADVRSKRRLTQRRKGAKERKEEDVIPAIISCTPTNDPLPAAARCARLFLRAARARRNNRAHRAAAGKGSFVGVHEMIAGITSSSLRSFAPLRLCVSLLLLLTSAQILVSQTIYAVVWGNPKYVVGSSTLHSGLFRSSDLGKTWQHLGPENLKAFSMDAVDSSRGRIL